jgi:hypothetical protein
MKKMFAVLGIIAAPVVTHADGLRVSKGYSYTDQAFAQRDAACLSVLGKTVAQNYVGLKAIEIPENFMLGTTTGVLSTSTGVKFKGDYGKAKGTFTCLFDQNTLDVTDIVIAFEGNGLGGYVRRGRSSPSQNPKDWVVPAFGRTHLTAK